MCIKESNTVYVSLYTDKAVYKIYRLSIFILFCCCFLLSQLHPTLCSPKDCSMPGSCVQGIFQARILQWVAISFSTGSCQPRDQTSVLASPSLTGRFFTTSATWETLHHVHQLFINVFIVLSMYQAHPSARIHCE